MSKAYYSVVTNIGAAQISNAALLGKRVNITRIAVGDAGGVPYQPTTSMTGLKGQRWTGSVTKYEKESDNVIVVHGVIPSTVGGFVIREMSVIDDQNNTIAIGNTPDLPKVTVEEGFYLDMEIRMRIIVTDAGVIEFKISPHTVIATMEDIANSTIDGGEFVDISVSVHNANPMSHSNMLAYGGTLEEHLIDPNAHPSIVLDGNIN